MNNSRFSFKYVVLEILIVIVGISIAFWVNNWGEERKERRLEREFLKTLQSELATDSTAFHSQVKNGKLSLKYLEQFVELCREEDYENDSLQWYVGMFLNRGNWVVNSNTYEMLKSGGKLDIITDFELRNAISVFYHIRALQSSKMLEIVQTFMDNQMDPYLVKNSDYYISNKPNTNFVKDPEFQNLLVLWTELSEAKLGIYEGTLQDIKVLIAMLAASLE